MLRRALRFFGSLRLAVFLLLALAVVCGWATTVERTFGTAAAGQLVYGSPWFYALGFALFFNILAAMLSRWPWKARHWPFLLAHFGVLILLAGCWTTHRSAVEGEMAIFEGETVAEAVRSNRWTLNAVVQSTDGGVTKQKRIRLPFSGGVFSRSTVTPSGWNEQVVAPALERIQGRGLFSSLRRGVLRAHYALVRWAAVASGKARPRVLYNSDGLSVELLDYVCPGIVDPGNPSAEPSAPPFDKERANEFYATVKLRVTLDGKTSEFWLRMTPFGLPNADALARTVAGTDRTCRLALENVRFDPGFALSVKKFEAKYEPGSTTPSSFSSLVDYRPKSSAEKAAGDGSDAPDTGSNTTAANSDTPDAAERDVLIRMNRPGHFRSGLTGRRFWTYQSSFRGPYYPGSAEFESVVRGRLLEGETVPREQVYQTVLTLNSDPGRPLKYAGSLLLTLGMFWLIRRKSSGAARSESLAAPAAEVDKTPDKAAEESAALSPPTCRSRFFYPAVVLFCALVAALPLAGNFFPAETLLPSGPGVDAWRRLPVSFGGRVEPLETFARQTVREITGSVAPLITPDARISERLENGEFSRIAPLEEYLKDEKLSADDKVKITSRYDGEREAETAEFRRIAARLRQLFPDGRARRFRADELIYAWVVEPEVWRYVPILADSEGDAGSLLEAESKNVEPNKRGVRLIPAEIERSEAFSTRIDSIQRGVVKTSGGADAARFEGKIDRACAKIEKNLSLYRAVAFSPKREVSPMAGFYLDRLLYPENGSESAAPLEELEFSVRRLKSLLKSPENAGKPTPFDDAAFELNQTLEIGTAPRTMTVLRLLRKIHLLSSVTAESPYAMNARLFASLLDDLARTEGTLTEHRDAVYASKDFSEAYRAELLRTTRLLGVIRRDVASAAAALSTLGSYRYTALPMPPEAASNDGKTAGERSRPAAAALRIDESGALDIFPFDERFKRDAQASPWASLQTTLYAEPELARLFFGERLEQTKTCAERFDALRAIYVGEQFAAGDKSAKSEWNAACSSFADALLEGRPEIDSARLDAEFWYDRADPFFGLWYFAVLSLVVSICAFAAGYVGRIGSRAQKFGRFFTASAGVFLTASFVSASFGIALRGYISKWAPVTNMFETVILLAFLTLAVTLGYTLVSVRRGKNPLFALFVGGAVASAVGLLAYYNTSEFNPAIRPIAAILRSNFWLSVHVTAIMASYALGAIAWVIALAMSAVLIFGRGERDVRLSSMAAPLLTLMRGTVLLLTLGTILGALWADFSWGRFWSWDPKEVWALVTLCIYLIVLHRRYRPGWDDRRLMDGGILGALAIVMTWYGLSFVFGGGGRHSYAAGETNKAAILYLLITANLALIVIDTLLRRFRSPAGRK